MTPNAERPLSAVVPPMIRHVAGEPLTPWLAVADALWREAEAGLFREPDGVAELASLADRFGWGSVLAAAGGVERCAEPERLRALPALAERAGSAEFITFWLACLFGLHVRVTDGDRDHQRGGEPGPPVVVIALDSCEVRGAIDRAALRRVLDLVVPAHLAYRLNLGVADDERAVAG